MTRNVAAWQARQVPSGPAFLSDPEFAISSGGDFSLPVGNSVSTFPAGYGTGNVWGSTGNQIELTNLGPIIATTNPVLIGPLGAANAGFTEFFLEVPAGTPSGSQSVTATLTGTNTADGLVYGDVATFTISW